MCCAKRKHFPLLSRKEPFVLNDMLFAANWKWHCLMQSEWDAFVCSARWLFGFCLCNLFQALFCFFMHLVHQSRHQESWFCHSVFPQLVDMSWLPPEMHMSLCLFVRLVRVILSRINLLSHREQSCLWSVVFMSDS